MSAETRIAQDLTAIVRLYDQLGEEAEARFDAREMPGGDAMNQLGPVALTEAWEAVFEGIEAADGPTMYANDQEADRHVLITLGDWSEAIRHERGQPTSLRVTVHRAADYIRGSLTWAVEHFEHVEHMARDLRQCRASLEAILRDGIRHDREATACLRDVADEAGELKPCGGQLERRTLERRNCKHAAAAIDSAKGVVDPAFVLRQLLNNFPELEREHRSCDQGGRDDVYRCGKCEALYTAAEYWQAVKANYEKLTA